MKRNILIWPNKALSFKSTSVPQEDLASETIKTLIQDMYDTMYDVGGVGLAAIQVGVALRVVVMDVKRQVTFINPVITKRFGTHEQMNEGCLSLPGIVEWIPRYPSVKVSWTTPEGDQKEEVFLGMEAQCCQHEIDHLDGITIPDKLGSVARGRLLAKMKKSGQ